MSKGGIIKMCKRNWMFYEKLRFTTMKYFHLMISTAQFTVGIYSLIMMLMIGADVIYHLIGVAWCLAFGMISLWQYLYYSSKEVN